MTYKVFLLSPLNDAQFTFMAFGQNILKMIYQEYGDKKYILWQTNVNKIPQTGNEGDNVSGTMQWSIS